VALTRCPDPDLSHWTKFGISADRGERAPTPQPKHYVFQAPRQPNQPAFKSAGITLVTEANNHGEDCGPIGPRTIIWSVVKRRTTPSSVSARDAAQAFRSVPDHDPRPTYRHHRRHPGHRHRLNTPVGDGDANRGPGLGLTRRRNSSPRWRPARKTSDTVIVYLHWGPRPTTAPSGAEPWPPLW